MGLSYELISQFAKLAKAENKKTSSESTVYGTVVVDDKGNKYVKLDGSDQLTPLTDEERPSMDSTSVDANEGERVSVLIKDHTATVTGNISSPAARTHDVKDVTDRVTEVEKFDILIGDKVQANEVYFKKLLADEAILGKLEAAAANIIQLIATQAEIEELIAGKATVTDLIAKKVDADVVIADKAIIESLKASSVDILSLIADKAVIEELVANNTDLNSLEAKNAYLKYANIDFSNIGQAAIEYFYSKSGLIEDVVVGDGTITGTLIGVTIKGDMIQGNTIVADKLVIQGEDGLYYKLNFEAGAFTDAEEVPMDGLHGSVILANSITAEKIRVEDLVAFGATIGGFHIGANSLYSGVKESIDNSTRGFYVDTDGQMYLGDDKNYILYYKTTDENGNEVYRLAISADSILFGADSKSSAADLKALTEHVKIGTVIDEETGDEKPCVELSEGDSDFKQVITNVETQFVDGKVVKTKINTDGVHSDNVIVKDELRHEKWVTVDGRLKRGRWAWAMRSNGNYGLTWKE